MTTNDSFNSSFLLPSTFSITLLAHPNAQLTTHISNKFQISNPHLTATNHNASPGQHRRTYKPLPHRPTAPTVLVRFSPPTNNAQAAPSTPPPDLAPSP